MRLAVACILKCKPRRFLTMFAIKCASWTAVNAGTSSRCPCSSVGHEEYASVQESNCMTERTLYLTQHFFGYYIMFILWFPFGSLHGLCLLMGSCFAFVYMDRSLSKTCQPRSIYLMVLVVCLGGVFMLEQPRNSNLEFYPMFLELLNILYDSQQGSAVPTPSGLFSFWITTSVCWEHV